MSRRHQRPSKRYRHAASRSYADRLAVKLPSWFDVLRWTWTARDRCRYDAAERVRVARSGLPPVSGRDTIVTWAGHASFLVRTEGAAVFIDPVWSARVPGVAHRLTPPGMALEDAPKPDAVLISHNHYDHLDAATMRRFDRATPVLVPVGLGPWFQRRGFTYVVELDWWESVRVAGQRFTFVPAQHWSRRLPWDMCWSLWGGWIITGSEHRLFHAGDTGYGPHFAEIGRWYPRIDVAMVPIGGYEPRNLLREVHMSPEEAVRAVRDLGARYAIGMHWGTFQLTWEPVIEPIERFRARWTATGLEQARLWDVAIGESKTVPRRRR